MALFAIAFAVVWFSTSIPQPNQLASAQTTVVYYAGGTREIGRVGALNRVDVQLNQVPKTVQDAVLAAEDRNFYHEPGISVTGIARALWTDVRGGDVTQGGSTITQQYAKNAYLTQSRTVSRKLREIVIALKLDKSLSKSDILRDYLNTIYFGRGAYGIEAASKAYFGKDVSTLTPAQGALLAAVIRGPGYYDPGEPANRGRAVGRWHYVVDGMVKLGAVTQQQADAMTFPATKDNQANRKAGPNGFVMQVVHDELLKHGFTDDQINLGGYKVITTISRKAQDAAIKAETDRFAKVVKKVKGANPPVSSLVSIRPGDGGIAALYGGRDYGAGGCSSGISCFNLATQAMAQPGSSFKPYTLATAIEQGISIRTRMDGPPQITDPGGTVVHNDSGESCMNCDLVTALAKSINTIFVPLADKVGPKNVAQTAHAAGIPDGDVLADHGFTSDRISLGVYPVHPIDQAVGFATFAARGKQVDPYIVAEVLSPSGHVLYKAHPHPNQAFQKGVADDVTYAMQHVVSEGTATAAQLAGNRPAAGKTGTTTSNGNAWFIGFTAPGPGQLCTAVWIGHAKKVAPLTDIPGFAGGVYGGTLPAEIWKQFTDAAMAGRPVTQFPPPKYVGKALNSPSPKPTTSSPSPTTSSPSPTTSSPSPTTSSPTPTTVPPTTLPPTTLPPPPTTPPTTPPTSAPPSTGAPSPSQRGGPPTSHPRGG
jgi:membrane peptidoglycan carboxypeptidase